MNHPPQGGPAVPPPQTPPRTSGLLFAVIGLTVVLMIGTGVAVYLVMDSNAARDHAISEARDPGSTAVKRDTPSASTAPALPNFKYIRYGNARFVFFTDWPTFMDEQPEAGNGDGRCWTWDARAKLCAWGVHSFEETAQKQCATADQGQTYKHLSADTCVKSGRKDDKIYWERTTYARGVSFSLRFEYDENLKEAFDPVVEHVNARFTVGQAQ